MTPDSLQAMRVLIVDDEPLNVALLEDMLQFSGYTQVVSTGDPRQVLGLCQAQRPDLLLLDLNMPVLDGFGVMKQLTGEFPGDECLPILVLTADITVETKRRALAAGATDFLTKPFDPVEVLLRIKNLLKIRQQHLQLSDQNDRLEDNVRARTAELRQTLSQLRHAQGQIIQQERLSALGSMTAGIAHDFNNVLSLILGYSEILMRSLQRPDGASTAAPLLNTVITAAQDAAKMFNRLREFYRPVDAGQPRQMLDLNALVQQTATLTRPRWHGQALGQGATVDLRCELDEALPALYADAAELREMLTNLIFNAVDALPQGGQITLRTTLDELTAGDRAVLLEVADNGIGMSEETRQRCLEPFFTTKGERGTGLGLAMVYGTVQRLGGSINLQSKPGQGTRFVLRLPLRQPETVAAKPTDVAGEQKPHHILVVDDQELLCDILVDYLTSEGHEVATAFDAYEALEKFEEARSRGHGFDLLITDRAMPGMNGEQLAATIKTLAPATRTILLTGYAPMDEEEHVLSSIDLVMEKPVTRVALVQGITAVAQVPTQMPRDLGVLVNG